LSSKESAVIFDDGSIESKVLQFELKTSYDITTVSVNQYQPGDLQKWIEKSIEITEGLLKGIVKVILHFPFEDYVQKDIRTEMMELQRKNPNLRIIPWYEQAPRDNIKNRAANYGIRFKAIKQTEVASDTITPQKEGMSEEFIKALKDTKPVDPDDEMKADIKNIASDIVKETKTYDTNIDLSKLPEDKDKWKPDWKATEPTKKSRKKKWNI